MDWIKLTSLRNTAAKLKRGVGHVELSKHASVSDCWILLGEKVSVKDRKSADCWDEFAAWPKTLILDLKLL